MSPDPKPARLQQIAGLMAFEAATLVVMSVLHLTDTLHGGGKPFDRTHAGIAEAVIAVVLLGGAASLMRAAHRVPGAAIAATGFAVAAFCVGVTFTILGGDGPGIAYHAVVLPLLLITLAALLRARSGASRSGRRPSGRSSGRVRLR